MLVLSISKHSRFCFFLIHCMLLRLIMYVFFYHLFLWCTQRLSLPRRDTAYTNQMRFRNLYIGTKMLRTNHQGLLSTAFTFSSSPSFTTEGMNRFNLALRRSDEIQQRFNQKRFCGCPVDSPKPTATVADSDIGAMPKYRTPAIFYKHMIKMLIRKFKPNTNLIVKCVQQTKFEIYSNRNATPDQVPAFLKRGEEIMHGIEFGIIPVVKGRRPDGDEEVPMGQISREMLKAGGDTVEPVTFQDAIERLRPKISNAEFEESKAMLQKMGRWVDRPLPRIKKRKTRCTDPDVFEDMRPKDQRD